MFTDSDRPIGVHRNFIDAGTETTGGAIPDRRQLGLLGLDTLVHSSEKLWFAVGLIWSMLVYLLLLVILNISVVFLLPAILLAGLFIQGLWVGHIRGNAVRVDDRQFPDVMASARTICEQLNMPLPPLYIVESGGLLNALATRFLMRDYVVLYSNIVEMAYEQGGLNAVRFVVAHEMAHIQRGHLKKRWMILPALSTPFLGKAYYRACEYTCDRIGAYCVPEGAVSGLLALAAGGKLSGQVNAHYFARQTESESGFWVWLSEILSTHPRLPKRVKAVMAQLEATVVQPVRTDSDMIRDAV